MSRYSEYKDAIDIDALEAAIGFEVVSQQGGNDIGHCLFPHNHKHGDSTGKFAIQREKKVYNCFVCGGGSLLSLVMELYDLSIDEATDWLQQFTKSDALGDQDFRDYLLDMLRDAEQRQATMPYFNERVLDKFSGEKTYFVQRRITADAINEYRLRYSDAVTKSAPVKHRGDERIKIDEDYVGPAAIFPHYWQGRLVGWQHRWMDYPDPDNPKDTDDTFPYWLAKYTNTTDFPKSDTLFNYDKARKQPNPVAVVESIPTALFLESNMYPAVAYFGDKPKAEQLRLLRVFSQGVILCPDNDKVGDGMLMSSTQYLERYIPVYHAEKVTIKPGADLGDYVKMQHPEQALRYHMEQLVHPAFSIDR